MPTLPKQNPFEGLFDNPADKATKINTPVSVKRGLPESNPFEGMFETKETVFAEARKAGAGQMTLNVPNAPKGLMSIDTAQIKTEKKKSLGDVIKDSLNFIFNPKYNPLLTGGKAIEKLAQPTLEKVSQVPAVKKTLTTVARETGGTSILSRIESLSPQKTYEEAYDIWTKKSQDPNNPVWQKFLYQLGETVPQTAIGVALSFIPYAGVPLSYTYWSALSAGEQLENKGKVSSITDIAIDTIGDRMLGNSLEGLFKVGKKTLVKTVINGFGVEGGTEVAQDLLKYSNDFQSAETKNEKDLILKAAKNYFTSGQILMTLGVAGVSGGVISGGGYGINAMISPAQTNIIQEKPEVLEIKETKSLVETPTPEITPEIKPEGKPEVKPVIEKEAETAKVEEVKIIPETLKVGTTVDVFDKTGEKRETGKVAKIAEDYVIIRDTVRDLPVKYKFSAFDFKETAQVKRSELPTFETPQPVANVAELTTEQLVKDLKEQGGHPNERWEPDLKYDETGENLYTASDRSEYIDELEKRGQEQVLKDLGYSTDPNTIWRNDNTGDEQKLSEFKEGDFPYFIENWHEAKGENIIKKEYEKRKLQEKETAEKEKKEKAKERARVRKEEKETAKKTEGKMTKEEAKEMVIKEVKKGEQTLGEIAKKLSDIGLTYQEIMDIGTEAMEVKKPQLTNLTIDEGRDLKTYVRNADTNDIIKVFEGGTDAERLEKAKAFIVSARQQEEFQKEEAEKLKSPEYSKKVAEEYKKEEARRKEGLTFREHKEVFPPKTKVKTSEEFKVGDVIENSEGVKQTIREIKGNSIFFTDENGQDYSGFSRTTLKNLVNGGAWKKISPEKITEKEIKKDYVAILDQKDKYDRFWFSGATRKLTEAEAKPLLEKGKIQEAAPIEPKRMVEIVNPDGTKETISWGEYLKRKKRPRFAKPEIEKEIPTEKKPAEPVQIVKAVEAVKKVIAKNSTIPILNNFKVENGKILATDLEFGLTLNTDLTDGIYKIVGKEAVKTEDNPADFPIIPEMKETEPIFKATTENLQPAIKAALLSVGEDNIRQELNGVLIKIDPASGIKIVSTDGYRLYQKSIRGKVLGSGEYVLRSPKKVANVLNAVGNVIDFKASPKEDFIKLTGDFGEITVRKNDAQFPAYEQIYPEFTKQYSFDRKTMLTALKELKPFAEKTNPILVVNYADGKLTLLAESTIEKTSKTLTVPVDVKEVKINRQSPNDGVLVMPIRGEGEKEGLMNFNIGFLIDAVNALEGDQTFLYTPETTFSAPSFLSEESELISKETGTDHNIPIGTKLFHGTTKNNAASIILDGINKTKDKTATYGQAIYLTPDYQTAQDYADELGNGQVVALKPLTELKLYQPTIKEREELVDVVGERQEEMISRMVGRATKYDGFYIPDDGRGDGGEQVILYDDDADIFEKPELADEPRTDNSKTTNSKKDIAAAGIASMAGAKLGEFEKIMNWKKFDTEIYEFETTCVNSTADKIDSMREIEEEISYNKLANIVGKEKLAELFPQYAWEGKGLKMKEDYSVSYYRSIYENKPAYFIEHSAIEYIFTGESEIKKPRVPVGLASAGADKLGNFEELSGIENKTPSQLKIYEKVKDLIKKYAKTIGEGYLSRNALGVYYRDTTNIRIKGMNNLSVAAHEITHFLDFAYKISDQLQGIKGYAINGNPIYESDTAKTRKEMTDLYEKYYPGAKRTHKLEKRMLEGFATLLEKYTEQPSTISAIYPNLVKEFLTSEGKYYKPVMGDILNDLREIITEYQGLEALDKIGTRVVNDEVNVNKESFLNFFQKVKNEISDNIYPLEVLAKKAGTHFTKADPSLWVRQYNSSSALILNNLNGNRGYWGWRNGELIKLHDFNFKDLIKKIKKAKMSDEFANYLVARREYFMYQEMAKTEDEAAKTELKKVLDADGFTEQEVTDAYTQNKDKFAEFEKMYDTLVREDLNFLHDPTVQLVDNEQFKQLESQEGYASFKRYFYDEIAGEEKTSLTRVRFGTTKVSSMIKRTGSQKPIINPLFSALTNHAEITRKSLKQIVYNSIGNIAASKPELNLFQVLQLKGIPDRQGRILFPQEKDPNIIMARINYKRKPILTDGTIKRTIDEVLTFQNIHTFEKLLMGASRFFTKGTTGLFPGFALTNYTIDQVTAAAQTRNNYIPLYDPLTRVGKLLNPNNPHHIYFQEYMVMGGERQTFVGWQDMTPNELFDAISKEKAGLLKVMDYLNKGMDILALPSKWSEITTRAVEYVKSRQQGKSPIVALEEAGRVTAPFHHIGRWGGGRVGQVYIKSIPFFNPGIQVLTQAAETLETPAGRRRYAFVTLAVIAANIGALGMIMAFGSDDQKDLYADLHPDELNKYLWFPSPDGKTLIKIRVPDQMAVIGTIINMMWADKALNAKYSAGEYLNAGMSWLPAQFDVSQPAKLLMSWIPQLIKPAVLTLAGVKDFPKIMPLESQAQQSREAGMRFTEGTSPVAKWLGETFNLSPIKIDYLLTGYVGRASGFLTGKPGIYNPLKSMTREYYFTSGRKIQKFYELKEKNDQDYHSYLHNLRTFKVGERSAILKLRNKLNGVADEIDNYKDIDPDKKPEAATKVRNRILNLINKL